MKILGKLFAFMVVCIVCVSCKNDYTCKCTSYNNGTVKNTDSLMPNLIKKDAIYFCDKLESDWMKSNLSGDNRDTIYNCNLSRN